MARPSKLIIDEKKAKKNVEIEIDDETAKRLRGKFGTFDMSNDTSTHNSFPSPFDIPPFFF